MSYVVKLSDEAVEDLRKLPLELLEAVNKHFDLLERNPVGLSRPSAIPYWPAQTFRFEAVLDGDRYFFDILFKYGADEQTLHVLAVPSMRRPW